MTYDVLHLTLSHPHSQRYYSLTLSHSHTITHSLFILPLIPPHTLTPTHPHTLTHREGYLLHTSLVEDVEDVNLSRELRPGHHVRKHIGSGTGGHPAPVHRGALEGGALVTKTQWQVLIKYCG